VEKRTKLSRKSLVVNVSEHQHKRNLGLDDVVDELCALGICVLDIFEAPYAKLLHG
jgi:hypothetical protein